MFVVNCVAMTSPCSCSSSRHCDCLCFCRPTSIGGSGYSLGSLRAEHAHIVHAHSSAPRRHERSEDRLAYIRDLLKHNPSACAYDDVSGKPVSWALIAHDGSGGFAYTLPEARGQRVYGLVGAYIGQQAARNGISPLFAYGALSNRNIQRATSKHWIRIEGELCLGVHTAAPSSSSKKSRL